MLNKQFLGVFLLAVIICFSCERNEVLTPNSQSVDKQESKEVQNYLDESSALANSSNQRFGYSLANLCTPTMGGPYLPPYPAHALRYSHMEELSIDLSFATFTDVQLGNQGYSIGRGSLDYGDRILNNAAFIPAKKGSTYNAKLKYWNHNSTDVLGYRTWIDWNRNHTFEPNEIVVSEVIPAGTSPFDINFTLDIPNAPLFGPYAMRTMLYYHGNHLPNTKGDDPCGIESGEIRDYTLIIAG